MKLKSIHACTSKPVVKTVDLLKTLNFGTISGHLWEAVSEQLFDSWPYRRARKTTTAHVVTQPGHLINSVSGCCAYHPNQNARCARTLGKPRVESNVARS